MLKIVDYFEKEKPSCIKTHKNLKKKCVKNIRAICCTVKLQNCNLNVYSNTTILELKNIIAQKQKTYPELLQIMLSNRRVLGNSDYNKTVGDVNMYNK